MIGLCDYISSSCSEDSEESIIEKVKIQEKNEEDLQPSSPPKKRRKKLNSFKNLISNESKNQKLIKEMNLIQSHKEEEIQSFHLNKKFEDHEKNEMKKKFDKSLEKEARKIREGYAEYELSKAKNNGNKFESYREKNKRKRKLGQSSTGPANGNAQYVGKGSRGRATYNVSFD